MLEVDIDKNTTKIYDVDREINQFKRAIRRRRHEIRKYCDLSSRLTELKNLITDIRHKIDALKQIISHTE